MEEFWIQLLAILTLLTQTSMEEFWIQLLALLILLTQTSSPNDTTELIGAVGGSVTFHSNNTGGNAALWSFGNDPIVTVAFRDPPRPVFLKGKYKTRFIVFERGRALSISQLRMEDAGTYSVKIDGKTSTFILRVYKELPEPTVTCEAQDCSDRVCLVSLRCFVTGAGFGNVSYTWKGWGQRWEERSEVLTVVDRSSLDNVEPLRCTARNAVSTRSVTVTIPEGLCPDNSAHPPDPGALLGSSVGIGLVVGVTVVVVILLVFLIFFCKSKGWRKFCLSHCEPTDTVTIAEYLTINAKFGPSQQRIPNRISAELTGGESSRTIHTLV